MVRCGIDGPVVVNGRMMWPGDVRENVPRAAVEEILRTRPNVVTIVGGKAQPEPEPESEAEVESQAVARRNRRRKAAE